MLCVFVGGPQLQALAGMLAATPEFSTRYPVHTFYFPSEFVPYGGVPPAGPDWALLVTAEESVGAPPGCTRIFVPELHFAGYAPPEIPGLAAALSRRDVAAACRAVNNPNSFSLSSLLSNARASLAAMRRRELAPDCLPVSDFVSDNYLSSLLFHTPDRPTNALLVECARRLLLRAGAPGAVAAPVRELLGDLCLPPPPCVYLRLGMAFDYPRYVVAGRPMGTYDAMLEFVGARGSEALGRAEFAPLELQAAPGRHACR